MYYLLTALFFQVKTECKYTKPANYPAIYLSGLKVTHLGNSSLTYQTSMFAARNETQPFSGGDLVLGHFKDDIEDKSKVLDHFEETACCTGEYTHVFVNPNNGNKPSYISDEWRKVLCRLQ
jgi:acyl-CoA thioesterase FadM